MKRAVKWFIGINIVCWCVATWLTSATWAPSGAEDMSAAGFDVILWVLVALPLAAVALVTNTIWTVRLVGHWRSGVAVHSKSEVACFAVIGLAWSVLLVLDQTHRYRGAL